MSVYRGLEFCFDITLCQSGLVSMSITAYCVLFWILYIGCTSGVVLTKTVEGNIWYINIYAVPTPLTLSTNYQYT